MEEELAGFSPDKEMLLSIGVFDGVHLGHKFLISRLKELAHKKGLGSAIITFRQHPQEILSPRSRLPLLTSVDRRIELLKGEGVDMVIPLSFTPELARLGARQFLELLKKHLRMKGIVVGPDFALGRNREGDIKTLHKLGREMGFEVTVVPPRKINGQVVSSTAIREALSRGDMERVERLAGRPFRLWGRVVSGVGRGRRLGFPTANLEVGPEYALPNDGVYISQAHISNQSYPSLTNIGRRPTFGDDQRLVEVYLLDYQGDLYGQELEVDILKRLRDEKKFENAEELQRQIAKDIEKGRKWLNLLKTSTTC